MSYLPQSVRGSLQPGDLLLVHPDPRLTDAQIDEVREELKTLPPTVFGIVYPEVPEVRDHHSITRVTRTDDIATLAAVGADKPHIIRFIHVAVGPPAPPRGNSAHPTA